MYEIAIENKYGDKLNFANNSNYNVTATGLTPVQSNIITTPVANYGGERFVSSREQKRNIVLTIYVCEPVEENRINLYKYIRSHDFLRIYYKNKTRNVYIDGYVEAIEGDLFAQTQTLAVSVICPLPNFIDMNSKEIPNSGVFKTFYMPFNSEIVEDHRTYSQYKYQLHYDLPGKKGIARITDFYLLPKTRQETTPTPENPVEPVGLGVLIDEQISTQIHMFSSNNIPIAKTITVPLQEEKVIINYVQGGKTLLNDNNYFEAGETYPASYVVNVELTDTTNGKDTIFHVQKLAGETVIDTIDITPDMWNQSCDPIGSTNVNLGYDYGDLHFAVFQRRVTIVNINPITCGTGDFTEPNLCFYTYAKYAMDANPITFTNGSPVSTGGGNGSIEVYTSTSPYRTTDSMAKLTTEGENAAFKFDNVIPRTGKFTLSFWVKFLSGTSTGFYVTANGLNEGLSESIIWQKYELTFDVTDITDDSITFTFPVDCELLLYEVMLESGEKAHSYVEWSGGVEALTEGQIHYLSDKYTDKIFCRNGLWGVERNVKPILLTGSGYWSDRGNGVYSYNAHWTTYNYGEVFPGFCTHFEYHSGDISELGANQIMYVNEVFGGAACAPMILVKPDTSIAGTLAEFKTWLNQNDVKLYIPYPRRVRILSNELQDALNGCKFKEQFAIWGCYEYYENEKGNDYISNMYGALLIEPIVLGTINDTTQVLVNTSSDDDIGFIYQIHCKGEVVNPVIYNIDLDQKLSLIGTFKKNDIITIDSRQGKKSITRTYAGIETNIINAMEYGSKWLQLKSGYNHIAQSSDSGTENMDSAVIYTNEYEGV